jgi:molecular chaperone Hsp33
VGAAELIAAGDGSYARGMSDSPTSPNSPSDSTRAQIAARTSASPDQLVRTISESGTIGIKAILGSQLVAEALGRRPHTPTSGNALGRAMMGALLIAVGSAADDADDANTESVQLQFRGDGPLGSLTAIADSRAQVRGTVQHPQVSLVLEDNTPDIARAIGLGPLNVVRHRPRWRSPYTGTVPLVSGEVAGDLTLYLTESEQTPSAMGLGVSFGQGMADVAACGFLVQALPGATDEELEIVEKNVAELPGLATLLEHPITPDHLIDRLLVGLGSRARHTMSPRFYCPCTHERALRTLALLERSEILEMIEKQEGQEVVCDFCGKEYQIAASEMSPILEFQNEHN